MREGADIFVTIPGARALVDWFGGVPTFHDAEILDFFLTRSGTSSLRVHTWQMTSEVDENGFFRREKHVVVTFAMEDITGLNLQGFNHQNVIDGIKVTQYANGDEVSETAFPAQFPPSAGDLGLTIDATYGVGGVIYARQLHISFVIGDPAM